MKKLIISIISIVLLFLKSLEKEFLIEELYLLMIMEKKSFGELHQ
ncbi:hypothetical protein [Clostridium gallinarum]|nr:hypothetical protein [Clostridium gallinarum]